MHPENDSKGTGMDEMKTENFQLLLNIINTSLRRDTGDKVDDDRCTSMLELPMTTEEFDQFMRIVKEKP